MHRGTTNLTEENVRTALSLPLHNNATTSRQERRGFHTGIKGAILQSLIRDMCCTIRNNDGRLVFTYTRSKRLGIKLDHHT